MARIFTINFLYEGADQSAMVAVRTTPFFTEYTLSMITPEIMQQLPCDRVISTANHYRFAETSETATELMEEILKAIASHAHTIA